MYNKKVLDHFRKPHNFGKMKNPDGMGKVGNIVCGDVMHLYIKVGKPAIGWSASGRKNSEQIITDVKFKTFGCVAAIATSSMITDLAKGKILQKALRIDKNAVIKSLGSLPPVKIHCSVLAADALAEAIYDYLKKNNKEISLDLKKRHKRIRKEKEIIEEKFKGWTNG